MIPHLWRRWTLPVFQNEEEARVARILTTCVLALLAVSPVFMGLSLLNHDWFVAGLVGALGVVLVVVLLLARRGHVYLGSLLTTLTILMVVTLTVTAGQGVHDVTIVVYPAVIAFASLMLRRRAFIVATLITIASVGWVVLGAMLGWYYPRPHTIGDLGDFINVSLILAVTALLVYYLADNMRQALAQARRQLAERMEAEAQLRANEKRFRALVDNSWESISMLSADGQVVYLSPASGHLLGFTPEARLGRNAFENLHPDDRPRAQALYAQLLQSPGQVLRGEMRFRHVAGHWIFGEIAAQNLLHVPEVAAVVVHTRDVTQRHQAEELLHQRLAELEVVAAISGAVRGAAHLEEMLPLLLEEILAALHAGAGAIVLADPVSRGRFSIIGRGWFEHVEPAPSRWGEGIAGHVMQNDQVYRIADFAADPHALPAGRVHVPPGFTGAAYPLRRAQQVIGAVLVAVPAPRLLSDDELRLLGTLAELAGTALHRAQLHDDTERSLQRQAALRAIDQAIASGSDVRVALNMVLEQIVVHLNADAAAVLRLAGPTHPAEFLAGRGFHTPFAAEVALHPAVGDVSAGAPPRPMSLLTIEGFAACRTVPLAAKGRVHGVLEVFFRHAFQPDADWLNFLDMLAGQAAIALDNAGLWEGLQRSNAELMAAYEATIEGWARALDLRERDTGHHARRVTELALRLARLAGLSDEELVHIRRGALLHDIGKMGVPDSILLKPGPLTDEEWQVMHLHAQYAVDLLASIHYLRPALDIPYCHHERWDGAGYPRGLAGEQIPFAARLFAVVDVWDALRSDRPYRSAWPAPRARAYLREQAGRHFDPQVVDVFLSLTDEQLGYYPALAAQSDMRSTTSADLQ